MKNLLTLLKKPKTTLPISICRAVRRNIAHIAAICGVLLAVLFAACDLGAPLENPESPAIDIDTSNAAKISAYLKEFDQEASKTSPVPLVITGTLTPTNWHNVALGSGLAKRYVALDLSACTRSAETTDGGLYSNGTFYARASYSGADYSFIVSIVLPDAASRVGGAFGIDYTNLKSVRGANVETIDWQAFASCAKLTEVDFPKVTTINDAAFRGCTSLTKVSFPQATTIRGGNSWGPSSIGRGAFEECTGLTEADFPKVTDIGPYAFYGCTKLTKLNFPLAETIGGGASNIGGAFEGCTSLTEADFSKVTGIGERAFYGCTGLTEIDFPKATSIGYRAFYGLSGITEVDFPALETIMKGAFEGLQDLTTVTAESVTTIEAQAFQNQSSLTHIYVPALASIGSGAFNGCTGLGAVRLGAVPPAVGTGLFGGITSSQTIAISRPSTAASAYGTAPDKENTVTENWGNAFRGKGWDGSTYLDGSVNGNISLVFINSEP